MSDLFEDKNVKPMLIGVEGMPFDDPNYIYELKFDGERCIAYLDENGTELRNKRNVKMLPKVPELADIHKQVNRRCILDGELAIIKDGKPDFFEIQRRSLMSNRFKIELASKQYPASFIAFDILYLDDHDVTTLPLTERKKLLSEVIVDETPQFAVSRIVENQGVEFYNLTEQQALEGIVAKRKDSKYYFDKRTKDWIKIKCLLDDDFVVCGFIQKEHHITSIILGQYRGDELIYKGHVTLGISGESFAQIAALPRIDHPQMDVPSGNEEAEWVEPILVCTVRYMMKTKEGGMRQPVFKGLRKDKFPQECSEHS